MVMCIQKLAEVNAYFTRQMYIYIDIKYHFLHLLGIENSAICIFT